MSTRTLMQLGGVAGMLGGIAWLVMIGETVTRPAEPDRGPLAPLFYLAMACIALGVVGVQARLGRAAGRHGTLAVLVTLAGVGLTLAARALVDYAGAPTLLVPLGMLVWAIGLVLFILGAWRASVLPRYAVWLLAIGAGLLLLFNFGNKQIWFGVPFGLAWLCLGVIVWYDGFRGPLISARMSGMATNGQDVGPLRTTGR